MKKKKFAPITVTVPLDDIDLRFTNEHHPQLISRYSPEEIACLLKSMCKAAGELVRPERIIFV